MSSDSSDSSSSSSSSSSDSSSSSSSGPSSSSSPSSSPPPASKATKHARSPKADTRAPPRTSKGSPPRNRGPSPAPPQRASRLSPPAQVSPGRSSRGRQHTGSRRDRETDEGGGGRRHVSPSQSPAEERRRDATRLRQHSPVTQSRDRKRIRHSPSRETSPPRQRRRSASRDRRERHRSTSRERRDRPRGSDRDGSGRGREVGVAHKRGSNGAAKERSNKDAHAQQDDAYSNGHHRGSVADDEDPSLKTKNSGARSQRISQFRDAGTLPGPPSGLAKSVDPPLPPPPTQRGAFGGAPGGPPDGEGPPPPPPTKPDFGLSGKLAEEANKVNGVVVNYSEPGEAEKPTLRWRLYIFKNGEFFGDPLYIHRQSAYLIGREPRVADIRTDHPSCSKQHAVLQYRRTEKVGADGMPQSAVRPYLMDLGSTNGTYLNGDRVEPQRYYELLEQDKIVFGNSSREYILLHDKSVA